MEKSRLRYFFPEKSRLVKIARAQLKVGTTAFGGPLATMSMMRVELVERENLVSTSRYLEGLAVVKLLPGPVATLLSVFLGAEIAGVWGGIVSSLCFIFPSFLMILGICFFEASMGEFLKHPTFLNAMRFVQVAVLGIIFHSCFKLFKEAYLREYFGETRKPWVLIFALLGSALALSGWGEFKALLLCAALGIFVFNFLSGEEKVAEPFCKRIFRLLCIRPKCLRSHSADLPTNDKKHLIQNKNNVDKKSKLSLHPLTVFWVFFKAGLTVFGTGYMLLPVLSHQLVDELHWILKSDFLNAVAYGNLTPGPIVIASTYMGFKVSGLSGALAATAGIFLGPIVLMLLLGPILRRFLGRPWTGGLMLGLIPAVSATIAVGAFHLGHGFFDPGEWVRTLIIISFTVLALERGKLSSILVLFFAAIAGVMLG